MTHSQLPGAPPPSRRSLALIDPQRALPTPEACDEFARLSELETEISTCESAEGQAELSSVSAPPQDFELGRLERRLLGRLMAASRDFGLIEPGDRVLVGISGGKDSFALLDLLRKLQQRTPFEFSLIAVHLDQGHPGFPRDVLPRFFEAEGYDYRILTEDTYSIVTSKIPEGKTYCSLCSRLRRGILYNAAEKLGATKIALGHHREDAIETLLLNLFYSGQIKAMPARLHSDDGRNIVIRPLLYCAEEDIASYAHRRGFPIIPCNLCGSQENLKRQQMKQLIDSLQADNPNVRGNLLRSLFNVRTSHLLDAQFTAR